MKLWNTKSGYKIILILGGRSNVFLVSNGTKNILVDTSPAFMWSTLYSRLKSLNITAIDYLVLTHAHFDHVANAKKIKEGFGAAVFIHRKEAENLRQGKNSLTGGSNLFTRLMVQGLNKPVGKFLKYPPCENDYLVDTRFDLQDYGFDGSIIHTPGHTEGSISVIIDGEIALVGDTMFGVFRNSAFPPFALDPVEMINSWKKLLKTGCRIFIPSHGSVISRSLLEKEYNKRLK
jgi:glyoxylase-like metal-dependent hydrolase (beta-lactamase superfamily II)